MPEAESQPAEPIAPDVLKLMLCPVTRSAVRQEGGWLIAEQPQGAGLRYPIRDEVPRLIEDQAVLPEGVESMQAFKEKYAEHIAG